MRQLHRGPSTCPYAAHARSSALWHNVQGFTNRSQTGRNLKPCQLHTVLWNDHRKGTIHQTNNLTMCVILISQVQTWLYRKQIYLVTIPYSQVFKFRAILVSGSSMHYIGNIRKNNGTMRICIDSHTTLKNQQHNYSIWSILLTI